MKFKGVCPDCGAELWYQTSDGDYNYYIARKCPHDDIIVDRETNEIKGSESTEPRLKLLPEITYPALQMRGMNETGNNFCGSCLDPYF